MHGLATLASLPNRSTTIIRRTHNKPPHFLQLATCKHSSRFITHQSSLDYRSYQTVPKQPKFTASTAIDYYFPPCKHVIKAHVHHEPPRWEPSLLLITGSHMLPHTSSRRRRSLTAYQHRGTAVSSQSSFLVRIGIPGDTHVNQSPFTGKFPFFQASATCASHTTHHTRTRVNPSPNLAVASLAVAWRCV